MEGDNNLGDQQNEYAVEMDVSSINHLLNMYNVNPTNVFNTTSNLTSPHPPIPFSSLSIGYNDHCPVDNISQMYDNIEPLYISEIKDMKNNILDILNHRSDFKDE